MAVFIHGKPGMDLYDPPWTAPLHKPDKKFIAPQKKYVKTFFLFFAFFGGVRPTHLLVIKTDRPFFAGKTLLRAFFRL